MPENESEGDEVVSTGVIILTVLILLAVAVGMAVVLVKRRAAAAAIASPGKSAAPSTAMYRNPMYAGAQEFGNQRGTAIPNSVYGSGGAGDASSTAVCEVHGVGGVSDDSRGVQNPAYAVTVGAYSVPFCAGGDDNGYLDISDTAPTLTPSYDALAAATGPGTYDRLSTAGAQGAGTAAYSHLAAE